MASLSSLTAAPVSNRARVEIPWTGDLISQNPLYLLKSCPCWLYTLVSIFWLPTNWSAMRHSFTVMFATPLHCLWLWNKVLNLQHPQFSFDLYTPFLDQISDPSVGHSPGLGFSLMGGPLASVELSLIFTGNPFGPIMIGQSLAKCPYPLIAFKAFGECVIAHREAWRGLTPGPLTRISLDTSFLSVLSPPLTLFGSRVDVHCLGLRFSCSSFNWANTSLITKYLLSIRQSLITPCSDAGLYGGFFSSQFMGVFLLTASKDRAMCSRPSKPLLELSILGYLCHLRTGPLSSSHGPLDLSMGRLALPNAATPLRNRYLCYFSLAGSELSLVCWCEILQLKPLHQQIPGGVAFWNSQQHMVLY